MTVNEEQLDYDEDVALFDGLPFTGVARAFFSDGSIKRQRPFLNGFAHGVCKEWYSNGVESREWTAVRGTTNDMVSRWHPSGATKSIAQFWMGVELSCDEWDEDGIWLSDLQ